MKIDKEIKKVFVGNNNISTIRCSNKILWQDKQNILEYAKVNIHKFAYYDVKGIDAFYEHKNLGRKSVEITCDYKKLFNLTQIAIGKDRYKGETATFHSNINFNFSEKVSGNYNSIKFNTTNSMKFETFGKGIGNKLTGVKVDWDNDKLIVTPLVDIKSIYCYINFFLDIPVTQKHYINLLNKYNIQMIERLI